MVHARKNLIGATVRRLRTERNLTQEQLAAKCAVAGYEIARGTLAKIEAQIRGVTDFELFVLAQVLRVQVPELFPARLAQRMKAGEFAQDV